MLDWTAGYVADVDYTFGYYNELDPGRVKMAFYNAGLVPPAIGTACELGFGQGLATNIHASASVVRWSGIDFNSSHAAFAQSLAVDSANGAQLFDESCEQFCQRQDVPDFDYIAMHGIWSWISDDNRSLIVDFLRRKLKVGGVVYISYNTLPGWLPLPSLRHLLTSHAEVMSAPGVGTVARIESALEFASKLPDVYPKYAKNNPLARERVEAMKTQNKKYVAHEYFNRDWQPMHFADVAALLAPAKLSYACSAHYLDDVESINLTEPQQTLLKSISDPVFRQSTRDMIVNQHFRRDYWVRGPRRMMASERTATMLGQVVMLAKQRLHVSLLAKGALGEGAMQDTIYNPILDAKADLAPRTIGAIAKAVASQVRQGHVIDGMMVLLGEGDVMAVRDADKVAKASLCAQGLNLLLMQRACHVADASYLASPVSGGGVPVARFEQLFLLAWSQGPHEPGQWVQFCWEVLLAQSQRIVLDGRPLAAEADNIAELQRQAAEFARERLPLMKALGIAA